MQVWQSLTVHTGRKHFLLKKLGFPCARKIPWESGAKGGTENTTSSPSGAAGWSWALVCHLSSHKKCPRSHWEVNALGYDWKKTIPIFQTCTLSIHVLEWEAVSIPRRMGSPKQGGNKMERRDIRQHSVVLWLGLSLLVNLCPWNRKATGGWMRYWPSPNKA